MTGDDELEARVTALEADVQALRQDVADVRTLAVGASRDVADFGARLDMHQRLLEALRETQIEHGARIAAIERRLDAVERRLGIVEVRLDSLESEMRAGFAMVAAGQARIVTLLERIAG